MFTGLSLRRIEFRWALLMAGVIVSALLISGCGDDGTAGLAGAAGPAGDDGAAGPEGPEGPEGTVEEAGQTAELAEDEDLPGVQVEITDVSAGGAGNALKAGRKTRVEAGDTISVTFTCKYGDGDTLTLNEMDGFSIVISGPTTHYQRVLPQGRDKFAYNIVQVANGVRTVNAVSNGDGSWTYTLPDALPATYGPPLYDTTRFTDGELTGLPLEAGTYTIGIRAYRNYTVDGATVRDVAHAFENFVIGNGAEELREVVKTENCNQCHKTLQMHGGAYRDVRMCILCHTAGAEDRNSVNDATDPTPNTIEFKVMIHKIHNGHHLPSVLGVTVNDNGDRVFNGEANGTPYRVGGTSSATGPDDYSEVAFPVWPNLDVPMPKDIGYSALPGNDATAGATAVSGDKATDYNIREGVTACVKCHGDPDGDGPLAAPTQGDQCYTNPSRRVCGSCHDDIDWTKPYRSNNQLMQAQANDNACALCHVDSGNTLDTRTAHVHPVLDPAINPGLNFTVTNVAEAGINDDDGTIDPGEKIAITFSMKDDSGANVSTADATIGAISVVVSGPTSNYNVVLNNSIPRTALGATADSYTLNLPGAIFTELVGTATGAAEGFNTDRAPIWTTTTTTVYERTATGGGNSTLSSAAPALQNYVDVADATGFSGAGNAGDFVVIDDADPAKKEFLRISRVDGNRLWFFSTYSPARQPGLRYAHDENATIEEVTLAAKTVNTHYTVDAPNGIINLLAGQFTAGNDVVVSYTSDFVMPDVYPVSLNGSPDLDETWGEWTGKSIVSGTYTVGIWSVRSIIVTPMRVVSAGPATGDDYTYRGTSPAVPYDFKVGDATAVTPYSLVPITGETCNECHTEVRFHGGGRRGYGTCVLCHGTAGSEDRPQYATPGAGATTGVTVNFRTMLHKIHMGEEMDKADEYTVNGFGYNAYPNNFTAYNYGEVVFPSMPAPGVKRCAACHGTDNDAWKAPSDRDHPTEQNMPVRGWRAVCGSCHDSETVEGHIDAMTGPTTGIETCELCHGEGADFKVEVKHKVR